MRKPYNLAKDKATSELEMFLLSSEINDNIATNACLLIYSSLFQRESKNVLFPVLMISGKLFICSGLLLVSYL